MSDDINWLVLYGILATLMLPVMACATWELKHPVREFCMAYGVCLIVVAIIFFLAHLAVSWLDAHGLIWPIALFGVFCFFCTLAVECLASIVNSFRR